MAYLPKPVRRYLKKEAVADRKDTSDRLGLSKSSVKRINKEVHKSRTKEARMTKHPGLSKKGDVIDSHKGMGPKSKFKGKSYKRNS